MAKNGKNAKKVDTPQTFKNLLKFFETKMGQKTAKNPKFCDGMHFWGYF